MTLNFAGPEVLVPKGTVIPPGDTTMTPLNWKLRLSSSYCGVPMPLNQQAKKWLLYWLEWFFLVNKESGLLLHNGIKKEHTRDTLGQCEYIWVSLFLLVMSYKATVNTGLENIEPLLLGGMVLYVVWG